jgi:hypothetical protein
VIAHAPRAGTFTKRLKSFKNNSASRLGQDSPLGLSRSLVPTLESQNLLDMKAVFSSAAILRDSMDQNRDFRHGRIHPFEQPQFEWHRDLRETRRPIWLDLAIFALLGAPDDFGEPLTLDGSRYSVVSFLHRLSPARSFALHPIFIERVLGGFPIHLQIGQARSDIQCFEGLGMGRNATAALFEYR